MKSHSQSKKPYFVILWQREMEFKLSPGEKLVYTAVKSFTANCKQPCTESFLSISRRAGVSDIWTKKAIEKLTRNGLLIIEGKVTKRGGSCPILKVQTELEPNADKDRTQSEEKPDESSNPVALGSNSVSLSSNFSGTKSQQSKKVIKEENVNNRSEHQELTPILSHVHQNIIPFRQNINDPDAYAKTVADNLAEKILLRKDELLNPSDDKLKGRAFKARAELGLEPGAGLNVSIDPSWSEADKLWHAFDHSYGWEFLDKEGYLR